MCAGGASGSVVEVRDLRELVGLEDGILLVTMTMVLALREGLIKLKQGDRQMAMCTGAICARSKGLERGRVSIGGCVARVHLRVKRGETDWQASAGEGCDVIGFS